MRNVTNQANAGSSDGPTFGAIIGAIAFWVVAIGLVLLTTVWDNVPGWLWALRIIVVVLGVGYVVFLILREKSRIDSGLPPERDDTAFDLWTIAHTMAGVVMGAWSVLGFLVVIYTIAWEFFERYVKGFGDKEIFANRIVDILVAWGGWFIVAAIVASATQGSIPWFSH